MRSSKLNQPVKPVTKKSATASPEVKEFIKTRLKPAIHQWLNNHHELNDSDKQKMTQAICRAYRHGEKKVSILKFQLPETIQTFLSQNAEAKTVKPQTFSLEEQLTVWVQQASDDIKQQQARQQAREKIFEAYQQKSTRLELSGLGLSSLPEAIGQLAQLAILELKDNQLTTLPESLARLTQLEFIDCSNNQLATLPQSLVILSQQDAVTRASEQRKHSTIFVHGNPVQASTETPQLNYHNQRANYLEREWGLALLQDALQSWEETAGPNEGRRQASVMIRFAYKKGASELNLSNLGLRELPPQLYRLQSLKKIHVSNNPLNNLPEDFKHFTALEPVVLTPSAEYTVKTSEVKKEVDPFLQSLQKWKDNYLRIMILPENLIPERKKLETVIEEVYYAYKNKTESLYLANLGSSTLPYQLTQLTFLKRLDISHNSIYTLPENIHLLTNLEVLIADNNNLETLPEGLTKLHHLKELYVKNNNLFKHVNNSYKPHRLDKTRRLIDSMAVKTDVDNQYNLLPYLEKLKTKTMKENLALWINQASGLEKESRVKVAAQLIRAREYYQGTSQFILEGHGVNSLPENVFSYLTHLTSFTVNNIKLTELPEDFSKLTSLWQLCFKNSNIPKIPSGIALLPALQNLAFSNCRLIELTKEDVGLLHNVSNLILNNNRLTALPDLSSLDNMRILNVSYNRLHEFPSKDFLFPRKVFKINLSGNNLETIPDDIGVLLDYPENQPPILRLLFMDRNPILSLSPKLIKNLPKLFYVDFNTDYIDDWIIEEMLVKYQRPQPAHKTGYFFLPDWHDKRCQTARRLSEVVASLESPSMPSLTVSRQTERPTVDVIPSEWIKIVLSVRWINGISAPF